jgi:cytoskeletal protein CcmA (bactofilin family)
MYILFATSFIHRYRELIRKKRLNWAQVRQTPSIIISETGYVNGNVYGAKIIIAGKVTGDVVGHENIRIAYTANIIGNITTKGLTIDKGCTINGKVTCNLEKIDYNQSLKPETPKNNVSKNELQRKGSPS